MTATNYLRITCCECERDFKPLRQYWKKEVFMYFCPHCLTPMPPSEIDTVYVPPEVRPRSPWDEVIDSLDLEKFEYDFDYTENGTALVITIKST